MAREVKVVLTGDARQLKRAFADASQGMERFKAAAGKAAVRGAAGLGLALGGLAAITGKVGIGFLAMKEQAQIAFTTMLGDGRKAQAFLSELQSFAAKTPFEFPELVQSSQKLLAMGFAAKEIIPTMTAIGDAVAGLGGSQETLNRVTVALGQIKAKGKASSEEMMQLTEAGIPAWDMLAKKMGVSIPEAMKKVSAGAVDAGTAVDALTEGMNSRFGGMMDKQSRSLSGLWSTLKDTFAIGAANLLEPLVPRIKATMERVTAFLADPQVQARIAAMAQGFADAVGFIVNALAFVADAAQRAWPRVQAAAQTAIQWYRTNVAPAIQNIAAVVGAVLSRMSGVFRAEWGIIKTVVTTALNLIKGAIQVALAVLRGDWGAAWGALKGIASTALHGVVGAVRGVIGLVLAAARAVGKAIWDGIKAGLAALAGLASDLTARIYGGISAAASAAYNFALDIGRRLVSGVIDGLGNLAGAIKDKVESGLRAALGAINPFSPVEHGGYKFIGQPLVDGAVRAIHDGTPRITSALNEMVKTGTLFGATGRPVGNPFGNPNFVPPTAREALDARVALARLTGTTADDVATLTELLGFLNSSLSGAAAQDIPGIVGDILSVKDEIAALTAPPPAPDPGSPVGGTSGSGSEAISTGTGDVNVTFQFPPGFNPDSPQGLMAAASFYLRQFTAAGGVA